MNVDKCFHFLLKEEIDDGWQISMNEINSYIQKQIPKLKMKWFSPNPLSDWKTFSTSYFILILFLEGLRRILSYFCGDGWYFWTSLGKSPEWFGNKEPYLNNWLYSCFWVSRFGFLSSLILYSYFKWKRNLRATLLNLDIWKRSYGILCTIWRDRVIFAKRGKDAFSF